MAQNQMRPLSVRIKPDLWDAIRAAAARVGIPVNRWVVNAIRAALEQQEATE
jgi:predicted HicB family RNase H-like nuclease